MTLYPHQPAPGQADTSAAAAHAIAPAQRRLQALALSAITAAGPRGLTADEVAIELRVDRLSMRPRASELRKLGRIRDSGARRPNINGKSAIVWVAA